MKTGLTLFRLALLAGWILLVIVSAKAIAAMGTDGASAFYFGDMAHPWRAQFNTDLGLHLLLIACWMTWRDRLWWRGLIFGICAVMFGAVFTFAFLSVEIILRKGDLRSVLLGARA